MVRYICFPCALLVIHAGHAKESGSETIRPYVEFLEQPHQTPVEYVIGLFERYDVVVLCERTHSEMTQYDFIEELISSPEFIENVGYVMTETGSNNYSDELNRVLKGKYRTDEQFQKELIAVFRECESQVLWPRTNWWKLHESIYRINRRLSSSKQIDVTMLNPAWVWPEEGEMTTEQYEVMELAANYDRYDIIVAENAINALYEKGPHTKALIIQNVPHHLKGYKRWEYTFMDCLSKRLPGRVANVKLNNVLLTYDPNNDYAFTPLPPADGRWDAAFAAMGNKPMGFDMAGSPFGKDAFEEYERHLPNTMEDLTYEDMFDGYIFYNPVDEFIDGVGIPGLVDEAFMPVLKHRAILRGVSKEEVESSKWEDLIRSFGEVRLFPIWDNEAQRKVYEKLVNQWK